MRYTRLEAAAAAAPPPPPPFGASSRGRLPLLSACPWPVSSAAAEVSLPAYDVAAFEHGGHESAGLLPAAALALFAAGPSVAAEAGENVKAVEANAQVGVRGGGVTGFCVAWVVLVGGGDCCCGDGMLA